MENVQLWQYVVIGGSGAVAGVLAAVAGVLAAVAGVLAAVAGVLAAVALMREERAALLDMVAQESMLAYLAGWNARMEAEAHSVSSKEVARKMLGGI